jgi:translation initiation factor eIF-2B subunit gamma
MFNPVSIAPTTLPKAQFRAVVLCGYGSDLYPLIEPTSGASSDEENAAKGQVKQVDGQIKALLPVAGKKMVDWVLERVEEAGVFGESFLLSLWSLS